MHKKSFPSLLATALVVYGLVGVMPAAAGALESPSEGVVAPAETSVPTAEDSLPQDAAITEGDAADGATSSTTVPDQETSVSESDGAGESYGVAQGPCLDTQATTTDEIDKYAAAHEGDVADGRYAIISDLSDNLALDVCGASSDSGASIIIWFKQVSANQRWDIKSVGGGYVTITSVSSGKVLDVSGASSVPGSSVIQWANKNDGSRNQRWIISEEPGGSYKITSAMTAPDGTHLVLDVFGGVARAETPTCVYTDKGTYAANQRWHVEEPYESVVDELAQAHADDLPDGVYVVGSALGSNLVLDVANASVDSGAKVIVWPMIPAANEAWRVSHDNRGYVVFESLSSGKVLDVSGGLPNAGASVIQWGKHSNDARNQRWIVARQDDGTYTITSAMVERELVLDVSGGFANPGAQVCVWMDKKDGAANQRWTIEEAPEHLQYVGSLANGTYTVATSSNRSRVLDVYEGSTKANAAVKFWTVKNTGNANQVWTVGYDRQGYLHLTNAKSGLELAPSGTGLVQATGSHGWMAIPQSNNTYRLVDAQSGRVLSVSSDGSTPKMLDASSASSATWVFTSTDVVYVSGYATGDTPIMGSCTATADQAARYLRAVYARNGWSLPALWTRAGLSVEKIANLFWEEGAAEGVRPDVAFAQSLHETGYFQFGGDVIPEQYNFAGIGTTGGGVKGGYFGNARTGIRAQIQHLKAYASLAPLKQPCVDPRFNLVSRGCAPTLSGLSGRWAVPGYSDEGGRRVYYHDSICNIMNAMASY